jgi:hypothetical protein
MTDGLCVRYCSSRDFQPSAAAAAYFGFGELEEALIHGGGGGASANAAGGVDPGMTIKSDAPGQQTKRKLSSSSLSLSEPRLLAKKARFLASPVHSAAQPHRARHASPFRVAACFHSYATHSVRCVHMQ